MEARDVTVEDLAIRALLRWQFDTICDNCRTGDGATVCTHSVGMPTNGCQPFVELTTGWKIIKNQLLCPECVENERLSSDGGFLGREATSN